MREIQLPPELEIAEAHGKVSWAVRSIWEEYSGWFLYDSTTSLYGVPRSSIDADLAELAGGAAALAVRAGQKLASGQVLESLHLLDIRAQRRAGPRRGARRQESGVSSSLLAQSGSRNFQRDDVWLRSEIVAIELS